MNAVAPDWNLKFEHIIFIFTLFYNAVAPDWNLKCLGTGYFRRFGMNAVAPDWNLKTFQAAFEERGIEECSRTRLEFKETSGPVRGRA